MAIRVVNIHKEACDLYMGRAGHGEDGFYGNPFSQYSREKNIAMFKKYFYDKLEKDPVYKEKIHDLKIEAGKREPEELKLGCFCSPKSCHVDIIVEYLQKI